MRDKNPGELRFIYVGDVALAYRGSRPSLDLACNSRVYQATKGWGLMFWSTAEFLNKPYFSRTIIDRLWGTDGTFQQWRL